MKQFIGGAVTRVYDRLPRPRSQRMQHASLRRDIQGLRALAVLMVISDHLWNWPSGGFVGVDVFFVVSGFLITQLMLREHDSTGHISWIAFYRRRIRRIVPVAVLVLVVTVVAAYLVYEPVRAKGIRTDALWSLVFLSNWHFAEMKTQYFNNENLTSPLQHYWSLAVEEQFYIVWPVVLIVVLSIVSRRSYRRAAVGSVVLVAAVASICYSLHVSSVNPTGAYFSTPARAWELAVGALLAVGAGAAARLSVAIRTAVAWVGVIAVVASLWLIDPSSTFPAPWAALPVAGAALLIVSGTGGSARGMHALTNPVSQAVGAGSYSLYLWHFPVIILVEAISPRTSAWQDVVILTLIAFLSYASYQLLEDPIRRSTWLERVPARPRPYRIDRDFSRRFPSVLLASLVVITVAFGGRLLTQPAAAQSPAPTAMPTATGSTGADFRAVLSAQIAAGLSATQFPSLSPDIDELGDNKAPQWTTDGCGTTGAWNADKCTYGPVNATKTVAVIGDSIALSWLPGLIDAFGGHGYRVHSFVAGECPAADVSVGDAQNVKRCAAHRDWAIKAIGALKPDLIVMSDASELIASLQGHPSGRAAEQVWERGASATLKKLVEVAPTDVLSSPPGSKNLVDCRTVRATPYACIGSSQSAVVRGALAAELAAAKAAGARMIDVSALFCATNGNCPSFVGNTPVYVDGVHLTRQYSARLAPALEELMVPKGKAT